MGKRRWSCCVIGSAVLLSPAAAQVDPPLSVPIPPFVDRGIREIHIAPGAQAGLFDITLDWDFEGFELPFLAGETRNLSTVIWWERNGILQGLLMEPAFILPDSGHFCDLTPCQQQVCGQANDGFTSRPIICRESIVCLDYPSGCDCRCGDTVSTVLGVDVPLAEGDVITVSLDRDPAAFSEFRVENNTRTIVHRTRQPGCDFDHDLAHTLADHAQLAACLNGPALSAPPACQEGDVSGDGRVDLYDASRFQLAFTGTVEPCIPTAPRLCFPLPGREGTDWVATRYVDLDMTLYGFLDHTGNSGPLARTYDGHRGTDLEVANFRAMDNDLPVLAAAAGWVEFVRDGEVDRNTTCTGVWNVVTVRHANGFRTVYGHIKQDSAVVQTGDFVVPGQKLAVVGSSGCSNAPQLHIEVRNCEDEIIDPFLVGLWHAPPTYNVPLGLMDAVLLAGPAPPRALIKDPPPNISGIAVGQSLGVGLSLAGGGPGDAATVDLRQQNGTIFHTMTFNLTQLYQHSYWSGSVPVSGAAGAWTVEVRINGVLARTYPLTVSP